MAMRMMHQSMSPLKEEMDALGYAMHAPKQIELDWSTQYAFNNYLAEAVVFLPGYDNLKSSLKVTANGTNILPFEYECQAGGSIVSLRYYVRKSEAIDRVVFKVRYRPSSEFDRDYTLTITVNSETQFDEPAISGP